MIVEWQNLENRSICRRKRAMKAYTCCITGKQIFPGDKYRELRVYQQKTRRHYTFRIHDSVKSKVYNKLRLAPNHPVKRILGFFQA